jgi:uncharacterized protein YeaO (DUF488 family)
VLEEDVIRTKRLKDPVEPRDGRRIMIARKPRPFTSEADGEWDARVRELAPTAPLLKYWRANRHVEASWETYRTRFLAEMRESAAARQAINDLAEAHTAGEVITLLCFCPDERRCHRSLVKQLILRRAAYLRRRRKSTRARR